MNKTEIAILVWALCWATFLTANTIMLTNIIKAQKAEARALECARNLQNHTDLNIAKCFWAEELSTPADLK